MRGIFWKFFRIEILNKSWKKIVNEVGEIRIFSSFDDLMKLNYEFTKFAKDVQNYFYTPKFGCLRMKKSAI